mmetsp:Transcript_16137/g.18286  ORF Transcript_16137/g.18286 Transcript_16137/m.18286 type:complete len:97 (-) Transcript_16137:155-445(-)
MNSLIAAPRRLLAVNNAKAFVALQTRSMCSAETFAKKGRAEEERYFREINSEQQKSFADMVHKKELKSLLEILPENHGLSTEVLHDILVWKHSDFS